MEALILLLIGVIAIPILLIISHSSKKRTAQQPKGEPGSKITVKSPGVPRLSCPRCGSPVMLRGNRWECGWCLDSGDLGSLSCTQAQTELHARIICRVDFVRTWADLKAELERLGKELAQVEKRLAQSEGKLNNQGFVSKAPAAVIEKVKGQAAKEREKIALIKAAIDALN